LIDGKHERNECYYLEDKKRIDDRNKEQDDQHDELKAMVEEIFVKQDETDKEIKDLRRHLDNGWKNDLLNRMLKMIEQRSLFSFKLLMMILGSGGIIAVLLKILI
jgi:hypothetical protein